MHNVLQKLDSVLWGVGMDIGLCAHLAQQIGVICHEDHMASCALVHMCKLQRISHLFWRILILSLQIQQIV